MMECATLVNNVALGERKWGIVRQGIASQGIKDVVGAEYDGEGECAKSGE
jgi:hypothetical protein